MIFGGVVAISRLHARLCPKCENLTITRTFKQQLRPLNLLNPKQNQSLQVTRNWSYWISPVSNKSCRFSNPVELKFKSGQVISVRYMKKPIHFNPPPKPNPLIMNTNVLNNVMLYRFERDWLMIGAALFAIFFGVGCLFMADSVYLVLCKDLFNSAIPLKERLLEHSLPLAAITIGVIGGPAMVYAAWYFIIRSIKYVILHKGGDRLTVVTYHPIYMHKKFTVPIDHISCKINRSDTKAYALLEIKNYKYHYFVDKSGDFVNPELFDAVLGLSREL